MNASIADKMLIGYLVKVSNGEDIVWVPTPWLDGRAENELVVPARLLDDDGFLSRELADECKAMFDKTHKVIHRVIYSAKKEMVDIAELGLRWEGYARLFKESITEEEDVAGNYDADVLVARAIGQLDEIREANSPLVLT